MINFKSIILSGENEILELGTELIIMRSIYYFSQKHAKIFYFLKIFLLYKFKPLKNNIFLKNIYFLIFFIIIF